MRNERYCDISFCINWEVFKYLSSVWLLGLQTSTWSTSSGKNSPTPRSTRENSYKWPKASLMTMMYVQRKPKRCYGYCVITLQEMNFQESGLQFSPGMSLSCNSGVSKELTPSATRIWCIKMVERARGVCYVSQISSGFPTASHWLRRRQLHPDWLGTFQLTTSQNWRPA